MNIEQSRLEEARATKAPWKKWGPYLSERQWGEPSVRTTAKAEMPGITSPTTRPVRGPTVKQAHRGGRDWLLRNRDHRRSGDA